MTYALPDLQDHYKLLSGRQQQSRCRKAIFWIASSLAVLSFLCACITSFDIFTNSNASVETRESYRNGMITLWLRRLEIESLSRDEAHENNSTESDRLGVETTSQIIVCYYTIPKDLNSTWELSPAKIDSQICTHVIVGFASVVDNEISLGNATSVFKDVAKLKARNPGLKVMFSAGGMGDYQGGFREMVKTHANRKRFIRSVLNVIKTFGYDGFDVDWEFPASTGANPKEKIHFVQLLEELRKEFDRGSQRLFLSIAVAAPIAIVDQSYDIPDIARFVDFVSVMSYDYHFYLWYFPITGHNAPLYPSRKETGYVATLNVNYSAAYWRDNGMPPEKLVIGIPTYGHSYQLDNSLNHELFAPATNFGKLGIKGFVSYPDICSFLKDGATRQFDNESKVPFAYKDREWVSYEDTISARVKAEWIKANGFKGAMMFSLNEDDWNATCPGARKNETFPLTRTISNILRSP